MLVLLGEGSPILGVPTPKFRDGSLILGALGEGDIGGISDIMEQ